MAFANGLLGLGQGIDQKAAQQGYLGVHYAVKALAGEPLPPETIIDITVVTAASLP